MSRLWEWYERHKRENTALAVFLFSWQLVHLYWLSTDVVLRRLTGFSVFNPSEFWRIVLILVDYTEIPAIVAVSLVYLNEFRKKVKIRDVMYFSFLNSQWLHILWITDEFVVERLANAGGAIVFPVWLAWLAIALDYLELPVIFDTTRKFLKPKGG